MTEALIIKAAIEHRASKGLATADQVSDLIDRGYSGELVLTLTSAQAGEILRLLTAADRSADQPL